MLLSASILHILNSFNFFRFLGICLAFQSMVIFPLFIFSDEYKLELSILSIIQIVLCELFSIVKDHMINVIDYIYYFRFFTSIQSEGLTVQG